MALIQGHTPAWEFDEKGKKDSRGWFPMYEWIGEKLEELFNDDRPLEEKTIRIPDENEEGVVWNFDLSTMTQRRLREERVECTRNIRRILKPS